MPITQVELGKRFAAARKARNLTVAAAAAAIDVTPVDIEAIENGARLIDGHDFERLGRLYFRPLSWFFSATTPDDGMVKSLMRRTGGPDGDAKVDAALGASFRIHYELEALKRLLGITPREAPVVRSTRPRNEGHAYAQGVKAAAAQREGLGLGNRPVADLLGLVEAQGVDVFMVPFPKGISGVMLAPKGSNPFIGLNAEEPPTRLAFSLAHEFGHVLMDRDKVRGMVSRTDDPAILEIRANAFASAFLVPAGGLEERLAMRTRSGSTRGLGATIEPLDVVALAQHFAVSREAVLNQLRRMRLIDDGRVEELFHDSARYWKPRRVGSGDDDPLQRSRSKFVGLAERAYRQGQISQRRLAEYLANVLEEDEARDLAAAIARD